MAESFVRKMNVTLIRASVPRENKFKGNRNALISELSFRLFSESINKKISLEEFSKKKIEINQLAEEVRSYISRLERSENDILGMELEEVNEAFALAKNLTDFARFTHPHQIVTTSPKFDGCGIIDQCEGDLLISSTLYEIKNVERDFRIADIRQLLTYCALNFASKKVKIDTIGLVNARSGLFYKVDLNTFSLSVSGMPSNELLDGIIQYVTADTPSK